MKEFNQVAIESAETIIEQTIDWLKCGYRSEQERLVKIRQLERGLYGLRANKALEETP